MSSAPIVLGGPGEYEAWIVDRALRQRLKKLPWSRLQFDRVLDDASTSTVTVPTDHQRTLHGARPWKHGLGVWRNKTLEWVGPITSIIRPPNSDDVDVKARDILAWTQKRFVRESIVYETADLGHYFDLLILEATRRDNPFNLTSSTPNTRVPAKRSYLAENDSQVFAGIQELARTGMDFTVWRHDLISGPTDELFTGFLIVDQNAFVGQIGIELDGMAQGNSHRTAAGGTGGFEGFTLIGEWEEWDPSTFGLLETFESEALIKDIESAEAASIKRWETLHETPRAVTFPPISHMFPGTFDELVPGKLWRVQVRDELFDIAGDYRITKVSVDVSMSGGTITETITPELVNVGSPAVFPELTVTANPVPDTDPDVGPDGCPPEPSHPDAISYYVFSEHGLEVPSRVCNWGTSGHDLDLESAVNLDDEVETEGETDPDDGIDWDLFGGLPESSQFNFIWATGPFTTLPELGLQASWSFGFAPDDFIFASLNTDGGQVDIEFSDPLDSAAGFFVGGYTGSGGAADEYRLYVLSVDLGASPPVANVYRDGVLVDTWSRSTGTAYAGALDAFYSTGSPQNVVVHSRNPLANVESSLEWHVSHMAMTRGEFDAGDHILWHDHFFGA